jgi:Tol biopolymer transport system component
MAMPASRIARGATAVTLVAAAIGGLFAVPAQAVWPGDNGRIVFFKAGGTATAPTAQIYSMNSNGQDQTNLSAAGGGADRLDVQPSVSPDGKRIAFVRVDLAALSAQIWVMRIDGSQQTDISNDAALANESGPAWTEDGKEVLFVRQPPATFPAAGGSIWARRANGKGTPRQLTAGTSDANPAMSPDGELLAFSRPGAGGARHLFVMKVDGNGAPTDLGPGSKPDWSPDSTRLVYGQAGTGPIMVVKVADPSQRQTLTGPFNEAPVWSPDGTQIAFMDCASGPTCQIALMTATGQNPHDITNDQTAANQKPDWQARRGDGGENDSGGGS